MFLFLWIVLQMHKNPQQLDIQYLKKKKKLKFEINNKLKIR